MNIFDENFKWLAYGGKCMAVFVCELIKSKLWGLQTLPSWDDKNFSGINNDRAPFVAFQDFEVNCWIIRQWLNTIPF